MKLKFKATAKDYFIFVLFCLCLLYVVAIAVLNISSFANTGDFSGFNPIKAFTKEYLAATIVFFVFVLAIVFTSVSSYFFERVKGFGFSTGEKEEKGYSRWETEKEFFYIFSCDGQWRKNVFISYKR